ncbi:MAG: hypothetical protein GEU75_12720 [Dehalococcoidia bacterium]|nr:hypothetical protein [Dehalococcoidia bacterium]
MRSRLAAILGSALILAGIVGFQPASAATSELFITQSCLADGRLEVTFDWRGNNPAASQQWLDLSLFNNGWAPGSFLGAGPLDPSSQRLAWSGLQQGSVHFVRLNQLLAAGVWDPSPTFTFSADVCGAGSGPGSPPQEPSQPDDSPELTRILAPIDAAAIEPSATQAGSYVVEARAGLPGGCARPAGYELTAAGGEILVEVFITIPAEPVPCTLIYGSYDVIVPLPSDLAAGDRVDINGTILVFTP